MPESLIDLEDVQLESILSRFECVGEPVDGMVSFVVGALAGEIVIGGPSGKERIDGSLFFSRSSLATVIEMLADVLDGKLGRAEDSRFGCRDGVFFHKSEADDLRAGAQTVWAHPQRETPTQVFIQNLREHRNGPLGERYAMSLAMAEATARTLLSELRKIAAP